MRYSFTSQLLPKLILFLVATFGFASALISADSPNQKPQNENVQSSSANSPTADSSQAELARLLLPLIESHDGQVSVAIKHLGNQEDFSYEADRVMPTASLIKLPLMLACFDQVRSGSVSLDDEITLSEDDFVPGSGVLTDHFSAGVRLHLRDAVRLMIVFSDNTATNLVIDQVGLQATSDLMEQLGLKNTKLHSKVYRRDTSIFPERSKQYGLGSTTAAEMLSLIEMLSKRELVSPEACQTMSEHLYACDDKTKIARFLSGAKIAHKTGAINATRCDAGWIDSPSGRILICVLTTENEDQSWGDSNEAEILCGRIAQLTYDHFNPQVEPQEPGAESSDQPLKIGSRGLLVESLQRTLNARAEPSPQLGVDGDFGPATESAVLAFQKANQLEPTGVVDQATWKALGTLIEEDGPAPTEQPLQPADPLAGPPIVSCQAWAIADGETGEVLHSSNGDEVRHPASTTKIMTALVACRLIEKDPELKNLPVTFSNRADQTIGSSSRVRSGETLPLGDLLYGLLLPSGNDAAVAIAECLGDRFEADQSDSDGGNSYDRFIAAMNQTANELGLEQTHFDNPHGLTTDTHQTSAHDLAKLALEALRSERFRKVVSTRNYVCKVEGASGYQRELVWKNTNRLLNFEGFSGVKTGTTQAAGACLVALGKRDERSMMVVVLGAPSSNNRYIDARNLFRWAWQQPSSPDSKRSPADVLDGSSLNTEK